MHERLNHPRSKKAIKRMMLEYEYDTKVRLVVMDELYEDIEPARRQGRQCAPKKRK